MSYESARFFELIRLGACGRRDQRVGRFRVQEGWSPTAVSLFEAQIRRRYQVGEPGSDLLLRDSAVDGEIWCDLMRSGALQI